MGLCSPSEIKQLLDRYGFRFSKSMGQNFLIDASVPERIVAMSGINRSFGVLEIGPGIGALTQRLCESAGRVTAVELDRSLEPLLRETLGQYDNLSVVFADVMKTDIKALLREKMPDMPYAVCANLPYNITTPVLTKLIDSGCFESLTVMVQREVARRICASAGDGDYGAFSVYIAYHTQPELLFDVPPSCFMPQPKVYSSVIKLTPRREKAVQLTDERMFFRVVRAAFAQRRKTLVNALGSGFSNELTKRQIAEAMEKCGLEPSVRGEKLSVEQFAELSAAIGGKL
ncbi:MAG: 16S rRNA (adenine(1518)-N(6)/adenine(1519)-N(6))-dimethyltransferase RsmA [Oscillospiraceae bacterium]|nr:16S rRNA (adenine(1518)-N(6)/adenine(1519)-N(6))-dimethyltransferase RsmA [Oscillospiraceae bacterium]